MDLESLGCAELKSCQVLLVPGWIPSFLGSWFDIRFSETGVWDSVIMWLRQASRKVSREFGRGWIPKVPAYRREHLTETLDRSAVEHTPAIPGHPFLQRLAGDPCRSGNDLEPHLPEVVVQGQCGADVQFVHDRKAAAVGKREVLVAVAKEDKPGAFLAPFVDGLDAQPG